MLSIESGIRIRTGGPACCVFDERIQIVRALEDGSKSTSLAKRACPTYETVFTTSSLARKRPKYANE